MNVGRTKVLDMFGQRKRRAKKMFEEAQKLSDDGEDAVAIESYLKVIELDPEYSEAFYNLGLIYKYQSDWESSLKFNLEAYRLQADDEASRWNLAIAATALRKWDIARKAWLDSGIQLDGDEGPINMNFGVTLCVLIRMGLPKLYGREELIPYVQRSRAFRSLIRAFILLTLFCMTVRLWAIENTKTVSAPCLMY